MIYGKDLGTLGRFYEKVLDLSRLEEGESFLLLGSDRVDLSIVQIPPDIASSIELSKPPVVREETPIKVSFFVEDIESLRARIVSWGGSLKPVDEAWAWRGNLHLDGSDPEGNVFQLRQLERLSPDQAR